MGEEPARNAKRSDWVASAIVEDILARDLKPGDPLPTESQMLNHYGVGRGSIREALRLLEAQGLVQIKPGPGGGASLGPVNPGNLGRTNALYFRLAGASYRELAEAMLVLEPWMAELAARRADPVLVEEMMSTLASADALEGDGEGVSHEATEFHVRLADLSGNLVLRTMAQAIGSIFRRHVLSQVDLVPHQPTFLAAHRELAAAIVGNQADEARRIAHDHIADIISYCEAQDPRLLDRIIEWR